MSDVIEALPFDIFKEEFPDLAENGNYAKKYIDDDPDACLNKIRKIGEYVVYEIFMRESLEYDPFDAQKTQKDRIFYLQNLKYIDKLQANSLIRIHKIGSIGSHIKTVFKSKPVLDEERRELLRICYGLCLWFANKYGIKNYSVKQKSNSTVVAADLLPLNVPKQPSNEKHSFALFNKMQEFFFRRERQNPFTMDSSPKIMNLVEGNNDSDCSRSLSALETLNNSILETISCEKVSFDNYIDRIFFDKESFLKMFKEIPGINVRVSQNEVSQWLYKYVMNNNPSSFKGANLPVENVSWYDAVIFCNRLSEIMGIPPTYDIIGSHVSWKKESLGFRLPTLNEWQFAAKGGSYYVYSGSNNIEDVCWYKDNSNNTSHFVGKKNPNGYGLYDMSGNVWEWCWDYIGRENNRYVCGGSWKSGKEGCQTNSVRYCHCNKRKDKIGFRIVQNIK